MQIYIYISKNISVEVTKKAMKIISSSKNKMNTFYSNVISSPENRIKNTSSYELIHIHGTSEKIRQMDVFLTSKLLKLPGYKRRP